MTFNLHKVLLAQYFFQGFLSVYGGYLKSIINETTTKLATTSMAEKAEKNKRQLAILQNMVPMVKGIDCAPIIGGEDSTCSYPGLLVPDLDVVSGLVTTAKEDTTFIFQNIVLLQ